jgi:hypothetical protein
MSEKGGTSGKSETGRKHGMSGKGGTSETSGKWGVPLLAQTVFHTISRTLPVMLVTRLSPVARRMCASEAHA